MAACLAKVTESVEVVWGEAGDVLTGADDTFVPGVTDMDREGDGVLAGVVTTDGLAEATEGDIGWVFCIAG